jgi:hypothetical protein
MKNYNIVKLVELWETKNVKLTLLTERSHLPHFSNIICFISKGHIRANVKSNKNNCCANDEKYWDNMQ